MIEIIAVTNLSIAIICAKWALELGFSELEQLFILFVGLFLGPLVLLMLYIRLIYATKAKAKLEREAV
jgi:hypothetical protein